jgi:HEAT repeat protein
VLAVLLLSGCYLDTPPANPDAVSEFLVDLLKDPNPEVRRTAAEALGKIGGSFQTDHLARTISDPDPRVREAGVIALGRLMVQMNGAQALLQALGDTDARVRRAAARSLGELDEVTIAGDVLVRLLKDHETMKRRAAIQALLQVETPGAFSHVALAVRDPDAEVRQGSVAALGEWWGAKAVPLLRDRLLHDPVAGVRAEAAYRLGKIGEGHLVKELNRVAESDQDAAVRRWATWASGQLTRPPGSG